MIAPAGSRILIIDDEPAILDTLGQILRREGYRVSAARSGEEALNILSTEPIELIVADLQMPEMSGMELTRKVSREWPHVPVLILTGHGSIETAVESMRLGASDFLVKPLDPEELLVRITKRLEEATLRHEHWRLMSQVRKEGRYGKIIGANPKMRKIFTVIERVSETPSLILIQGEPGTGKELIARAVHERSIAARKLAAQQSKGGGPISELDYPYIAVNCGAFSRTLLESQLFGHKKGTFTGAVADQEGVFVAARFGTLFLDEITELDFDLQVKLLRALQEREVTPLGSTRPVPIHARIIAATNQPISELVHAGRFRADLYYRINVVNIRVPPLRERIDDLPLLLDYFLDQTAEDYGVVPRRVTPEVMEALQSYHWPGNVRELQNVVERAFALGTNEEVIQLEDLPPELVRGPSSEGVASGDGRKIFPSYDQVVRDHLVRALQASRGIKTKAATLLQIDRNRLYRLMRKYDIPQNGE